MIDAYSIEQCDNEGECNEVEGNLVHNGVTSEEVQRDRLNAIEDVVGLYAVADVRGIGTKFAHLRITNTNGGPLMFLQPEAGEGWFIGGQNCDGRYRNDGIHVAVSCDTYSDNPNGQGSFFTIQKLPRNEIKITKEGKTEFQPDPNDKGSYSVVYHDWKSGRMILFMLKKK